MEFYKLEATGNDFIITILDDVNNLNIKQLCDRHKGIGADGLIILTHIIMFLFIMQMEAMQICVEMV